MISLAKTEMDLVGVTVYGLSALGSLSPMFWLSVLFLIARESVILASYSFAG